MFYAIFHFLVKKTKGLFISSENDIRPVQCINTVSSTSFLIGVTSGKSPHTFTSFRKTCVIGVQSQTQRFWPRSPLLFC